MGYISLGSSPFQKYFQHRTLEIHMGPNAPILDNQGFIHIDQMDYVHVVELILAMDTNLCKFFNLKELQL